MGNKLRVTCKIKMMGYMIIYNFISHHFYEKAKRYCMPACNNTGKLKFILPPRVESNVLPGCIRACLGNERWLYPYSG